MGFIFFLVSCKKEKGKDPYTPIPQVNEKILVLCEGNFQWGNAEFDLFDEDSLKLFSSVFAAANQGNALGDVLQSALHCDSLLWLVVNNSGKLVGVDAGTFEIKREIKGLKSPRYMLYLGDGIALVTDLFANKLSKVDLRNKKIISSVSCKGWTENLIFSGNEIAVASGDGKLYWLDKNANSITDSTTVRTGCRWLRVDKNKNIWALASDSGKSVLYQLSPAHQILQSFTIPFSTMKLDMNPNGDSLYFLGKGLYTMNIHATEIPASPVFSESGFEYYGLGVNPKTGSVYISNAKDYVSKGEFVVWRNGAVKSRMNCGINPGEFYFYH